MLKRLVPLFILTLVVCVPANVAAQSSLQNNPTTLQQETGQTQNTRSLQDNTAGVQTNNSSGVLDQSQPGSLGVVSDPKQTQPDVTVEASPTAKASLTEIERDNNRLWIVLAVLSFVGLVMSFRTYRKAEENMVLAEAAPAPKPKKAKPAAAKTKKSAETSVTKKASKPKSKKKKKKSHR